MQQVLRISWALALLSLSLAADANDAPEKDKEVFTWQAMLGVAAVTNDSILKGNNNQDDIAVSLLLDVYYRGFFIQSENRRFDARHNNASIGYRFIEEQNWEMDVLVKSYVVGFDEYGQDFPGNSDAPVNALRGIKPREYDGTIALRYTRFNDESIFWLDVGGNALDQQHEGWIVDTYYSYLIPVRNWDIYLGIGATIYSSEMVDYYYGIDRDEVTDFRPYYQGSLGARIQFEAMAQYPISQSWILRGGISQSFYSSSITDSPIVGSHIKPQASIEISYVF